MKNKSRTRMKMVDFPVKGGGTRPIQVEQTFCPNCTRWITSDHGRIPIHGPCKSSDEFLSAIFRM